MLSADKKPRVVFVTGGVLSSLGKGIAAASLGTLLEARGLSVHMRKFEPYLNVDPGTMSPYQHGEVYVTEDGAETDLDLGHYERFTTINTTKSDAVSTGQVYAHIIAKERRGDYLGATVQVVPHVTDTIQEFITRDLPKDLDVLIVEIGGTVGDIEGLPFIEAIRQFAIEYGREHVLFMHLTLVPFIKAAGELKTKPSQHSVKQLQSMGIQPDVLLVRSEIPVPESARHKLALFCNVAKSHVISAPDVDLIYALPLTLHDNGLDEVVCNYFRIKSKKPNLSSWQAIVKHQQSINGTPAKIAVVGKYTELGDAYKSLKEALIHASIAQKGAIQIDWINAEELEQNEELFLKLTKANAILVPGGYGERGVEGKLKAIQYARTHNIPFLGICLGMQLAVIEFARSVADLQGAGSTEFSTPDIPLVGLLTQWQATSGDSITRGQEDDLGGTMRLGAYPCTLQENSKARNIYKDALIFERHRHRYEVNLDYQTQLEEKGLVFSGLSPDGRLPEIIELKDHPWFIAVQFHPEFKSRPRAPHPLFKAYVQAALEHAKNQQKNNEQRDLEI